MDNYSCGCKAPVSDRKLLPSLTALDGGKQVTSRRQRPRMVVTGPSRPTVPFAIAFGIAICSLFLLIVRLAEHPDPVKSIFLLVLACAPVAFFRVHLEKSADDK